MRGRKLLSITLLAGLLTGMACAQDGWAPRVSILPGSPDRAQLLGEWFQSQMSNIEFSNSNTGSRSGPSGERTNIRFLPNGTFKLGWLKQSALYNCTMSLFGYKTGLYRLDGSTLTIEDREASLTSRDNCHPQWNYQKQVPLKTFTYEVLHGQTKYGLVLVLRHAGGRDEVYERENGKSLLGN
jgi:hypothetical protein